MIKRNLFRENFEEFKNRVKNMWPKLKYGISPQESNLLGRKIMSKLLYLRNIIFLRKQFNRFKNNAAKELKKELTSKIYSRLINKNENKSKLILLSDYFKRFLNKSNNLRTKSLKNSFGAKIISSYSKKFIRSKLLNCFQLWRSRMKYYNKAEDGINKVK